MGKTRTKTSPPGSEAGFTLLELLVVLILVAAAAAVVIPSFIGGLGGIELETAARDLVTRMRQARTDAVARQSVFRVVLRNSSEEASEYALVDEYGRVIKSYRLPRGVAVNAGEAELPLTISFYPNGRSSGGKVSLESAGPRKRVVLVDPVTGLGRVLRKTEIAGDQ